MILLNREQAVKDQAYASNVDASLETLPENTANELRLRSAPPQRILHPPTVINNSSDGRRNELSNAKQNQSSLSKRLN